MKYAKREKRLEKVAAAAFLLGVFALNPMAHAETKVEDVRSVNLDILNKVVDGLEVKRDEDGTVYFAGMMPERCATNSMVSSGTQKSGGKSYRLVTVRLPESCGKDFKRIAGEPMVDAADVLSVKINDSADGAVVLHDSDGKSRKASIENHIEPLMVDGNPLVIISKQTREAEAQKKAEAEAAVAAEREEREAALREKKEQEELSRRVADLCKKGDYDGLSSELEGLADLLGDVSGMMDKVNNGKKAKLKKDLLKAETVEDAVAAYEAFLAAASQHGWDEEELRDTYIDKRFDILNATISEVGAGDVSANDGDSAIQEWMRDLRSLHSRTYNKRKQDFATLYGDIAAKLNEDGKKDQAAKMFEKAYKLSDSEGKDKIDTALAKAKLDEYKACVDKAKKGNGNFARCDKIAEKSKSFAERMKNRAENKGSDEEANEQLASINSEIIGTFGGGPSYSYTGFGQINQVPGAAQQYKVQAYQEHQQNQYMRYMQQSMYGGMNPGMGMGLQGSFSFR